MDAQVGRDTTACAPTVAPATAAEHPCNPLCSRTDTVPGGFDAFSAWTKHAGHRPRSSKQRQSRKARRTHLGSWRTNDASTQESSGDAISYTSGCPLAARIRRRASRSYYPNSSRLVCRSRSGPMRGGTPHSHHDLGGSIPSVLALIGAYDIALRCTLGTARKPLFEAKVFDVCAKDGLLLPISLSPQQPFPSSPIFGRGVSPGVNHAKEKKCWTGRRIVPLGLQSHSAVRQCTGSRVCRDTDHRDEESSEEDRPFLPRFLLQEIISAHRPYEGVFHNRPSLQGNLLCRSDWLRLRGIAETECMILPVRELAAFPRCAKHLRAGERPSTRRSPVLLEEFRWQSDPVLQAALFAPSMTERDIILESPTRWPAQEAPRAPALANVAGSAALRNGTDGATAAVVRSEHKVASAPRNKQLSTSHHFPAITSPRHSTHPTFLILHSPMQCPPTLHTG